MGLWKVTLKTAIRMFLIPKKKKKEEEQPLREDLYLVTQAVDTKSIDQEQKTSDLEQLEKAEEKSNYRSNIAKSIKNPQVSRAATALQLKNPFKGV